MKNMSIWKQDVVHGRSRNILRAETKTDILIIGGGIAGLSTGLSLLSEKKDFMIVEKRRVGMGISANSTGKLTFVQGSYDSIRSMYDYGTALKYCRSQQEAIEIVRKNVSKYKIKCGLETVDSYFVSNCSDDIEKIKKEETFYRKAKIPYHRVRELPNSSAISYGIRIENTAVFDPVQYLLGVKRVIDESHNRIYENTTVHSFEKMGTGYVVFTDRGKIYTNKLIVCTHSPFFVTPGLLHFRTYIEKSYLLASVTASYFPFSSISSDKISTTMRGCRKGKNNYFLYGGYSHRSSSNFHIGKQFEGLLSKYNHDFSDKVDYIWSNHDVMTNDHIPYIGVVDSDHPNLYLATGFNTWGMTNGTIAGKVLSDLIVGKPNNYKTLFSLQRKSVFDRTYKLIQSNFLTGSAFLATKVVQNYSFYSDHVSIIQENGQKIGVYKSHGREYRVNNTCPHLGCSLIFNEFEKTWDCPCHGSRFDVKGNCISGPSSYSIKLRKDS